ncbi:MAG: M20/M25/M40 family metallo-hydrolase [Firmicutes bacterium]|nr:M20/M25/M40 family metallo-hydrolase [Bacillota bacterium]
MMDDVFSYLEKNFSADLEAVRTFLRQPSISYTSQGIAETAELVRSMIADLGGAAQIIPTPGHPLVYGRLDEGADRTLLYYSMYDVMPADEPGWSVDPFAAEIVDLPKYGSSIVARGAVNTKGPTAAFFRALKAYKAVRGKLPVNLIFIVEGEEEMGSRHFNEFVPTHKHLFAGAEAAIFPFFAQDEGLQTFMWLGTKGLLYFELTARGGEWGGPRSRGIHGCFAGWVHNPVWRLVQALATMVGPGDRILVQGLADGAIDLSKSDRQAMADCADLYNERDFLDAYDVKRLKWPGQGVAVWEKLFSQPTLNIDGIWGGYTGPETKTLVPHQASTKMDVRLVPRMEPDAVVAAIRKHLDDHGFSDVEMKVLNKYHWSKVSIEEPVVQAMLQTYQQLGRRVQVQPLNPGSAPYWIFERVLGIPYISGGLGHGSRQHSSDEYCTVQGLLDFEKSMVQFLDNYPRIAAAAGQNASR